MDEQFLTVDEPVAIHASQLIRHAETGAFGFLMMAPERKASFEINGRVAVLDIRGPLVHHADCFGDSYDGIKARMWEACSADVDTVLLSIDSPGGMVSGCFDCADEIRAIADAGGKRLVAYVDGTTCSAAYALACAAEQIAIPPAGIAGSVGVLAVVQDYSNADKSAGINVTVIRSGARKADGLPDEPLSDAGAAEIQRTVDAQAAVFFDLVSRRRGLDAGSIAGWEGRVFVGADAVAQGLADTVASEDQFIATLNGESSAVSDAPEGQENKSMDLEEMKKSLKALAEGEDKEQAKRAQAALAALEGEPDGDEKAEGEEEHSEPDGDEKTEEKAEGEEEEDKGAKALAMVEGMKRDAIIAARPDLTDSQRKALAGVPLSALAGVVAAIPRLTSTVASAQAALGARETQAPRETGTSPAADAIVRAALGVNQSPVTERIGNTLTMRACTPAEALKLLATLESQS